MRRFHPPTLFMQERMYYERLHIDKISRSNRITESERLYEVSLLSKSLHSFRSFLGSSGTNLSNKLKETNSTDIVEVMRYISLSLSSKGIDVVIGGSVAASALAMPPRMTKDIDINLQHRKKPDVPISREELQNALSEMKEVDMKDFQYVSCMYPAKRSVLIMGKFDCMKWPVDMYIYTSDPSRRKVFSDYVQVEDS